MSVDYDAVFGLGYELEGDYEDLYDLAYDLELINCSIDQFGCLYSCITTTIITINSPFRYGLDISKAKAELDSEIERLGLVVASEFGLVGDVLVS